MYIHLAASFEYFSHLACLSGLYRIETLFTQCLSEVGLAVPDCSRAISVDALGNGQENGNKRLTEPFIAENVTLVTATFAADDLGPLHSPRTVGDFGDGAWDGIKKGWPCTRDGISSAFQEIPPRGEGKDGQPHPDLNSAGNETAGVNTQTFARSYGLDAQDVQPLRKARILRRREHECRRR